MEFEKSLLLNGKVINVDIQSNVEDWKSLSPIERREFLSGIEAIEGFLVNLRREIKEVVIIEPESHASTIKPGMEPMQVIKLAEKWIKERSLGIPNWEILWINSKTGQVAYNKWMCDPSDDGYIKGFQIAFDIGTNRMICRNADNIWISLHKRGFVRVENLDEFKTLYSKWTNK